MECKATSDLLLTMTSNQDQLKEQFPEAYRDFSIDKLFATLAEAIDKDDLMPASKAALLGKLCRYPHKKTANKVYLGEKTLAQALQAEVFPAIDSLYENKKLYIEEKYLENSLNKEGKEEIKIKWRKVDYSEILKQFKTTLENSKIFDYCDILNQLRDRCIELFNQEKLLTTNSLIAKQGMTFHINDLFVPLGLVERQRPSKRQDIESADLGSQLYQPTEDNKTKFDDQQQFFDKVIRDCNTPNSKGKRIAIIGEAGSGKTTLLQKIGEQLLQNSIPIWISLKRLGNQSLHQYLSEEWLKNAAQVFDTVSVEWKTALEELLKTGQVFLLLDGVDEMTTTSPLQAIEEQINQCKIFDSARVILTCRSNLWEDYALPGFDAYQNLYCDYPTQVEQFIDKFFQNSTENKDLGETLKTELRLENKSRIQDLVKNPLRLFLLCYAWILGEGQLPDTQAELYKLFVENFYKVYQLKGSNFTIPVPKRKQLEKGLGELSQKALDDKKFLLPKSVIEQYLGDPDDQDSLFYLGKKLNLLNCVDKCAGNPFEDAYAFLHSTFQEYFAALVIDDWRKEFLNHVPHNPNLGIYRIFQPQWKQVILFYLGKKEISTLEKDDFIKEKDDFIKNLIYFNDQCQSNFFGGCGFYNYKAYFLALEAIGEFNSCYVEQIVEQVLSWGFGFVNQEEQQRQIDVFQEIKLEVRKLLLETNQTLVIKKLIDLLKNTDVRTRIDSAEILGKIVPNHPKAIESLLNIINSSIAPGYRMDAAIALSNICNDKKQKIEYMEELCNHSCPLVRSIASEVIGNIEPEHPQAVTPVIIEIEKSPIVKSLTSLQEIEYWFNNLHLSKNISEKESAIEQLGNIISNAPQELCSIIEDIIYELVSIMNSTSQEDDIFWESYLSLSKLAKSNPVIFVIKLSLIINNRYDLFNDDNLKHKERYYKLLWQCSELLSYDDFDTAWNSDKKSKSYNLEEILKQLQPNDKKSPLKIDNQFDVYVILIDNSNFMNSDNPALNIYVQMVKQNCPKCSESRPKTMQELNAYWQLDVNIEDKPLFLLFYPKPKNGELLGWSDRFLQDLDKFEGNIGIIAFEPINSLNLRSFLAGDPQLIENILGWMRSIVLEQ